MSLPAKRPMKIGFNARALSDARLRGFARHTFDLLKAMQALEPSLQFHFFSDQPIAETYLEAFRDPVFHFSRFKPHLGWEQLALPAAVRRSGISVFHSTANLGVPLWVPGGVPRVVTLHDMIAFRSVTLRRALGSRQLAVGAANFWASQYAALTAEAIITVSECSKKEIVRDFPRLESKIHVIHNGVEPRFSPGTADPATLARHGIRGKYLLYLGGFEERKNVGIIAQAVTALSSEIRSTLQVVLGGDPASASPKLREQFAGIPTTVWAGYVPDSEIVDLYRGASAFVLPSKEEGFGLQVLEAMGCGTPVLLSNASSLPEVGGRAAAYFDPGSPVDLARLIERALSEPAWREERVSLGLLRAGEFTWSLAARKTLEVYRGLLS